MQDNACGAGAFRPHLVLALVAYALACRVDNLACAGLIVDPKVADHQDTIQALQWLALKDYEDLRRRAVDREPC